MFEHFTDRARKVMEIANQEAIRFNHEYIGTEHILLGLAKEGGGVGANVLKNLGIDLGNVCLEVEKLIKPGPHKVTLGKLPQTPRAKNVIKNAIIEARSLGHNYVGTEHILLGLLRDNCNVARQILLNLGLNVEQSRQEILAILSKPHEPVREEPEAAPAKFEGISIYRLFTDRALTAMTAANEEAIRMKYGAIATEHLLLGIIRQEGVATAALKGLGIEGSAILATIDKLAEVGTSSVVSGKLPQMPEVSKAIEYAAGEAGRMNHHYIGTEHLLLGLMAENEGAAGRVLRILGVNLEGLRSEILGDR